MRLDNIHQHDTARHRYKHDTRASKKRIVHSTRTWDSFGFVFV